MMTSSKMYLICLGTQKMDRGLKIGGSQCSCISNLCTTRKAFITTLRKMA
ncbi:MAG: hypothetical protein GY714_21560 [Desulfobacterales bacterium]|nr:hypothetical protein [Desulfobacterales bacterium]